MPRAQAGKAASNAKADEPDSFYQRSLKSVGKWTVDDGVIIGAQDPPGSGLGGYLVSDETFDDFELLIDARPDWAVDTGVLVRTTPAGNVGYQMLIDHRKEGGIGGFYGNGLANFHAMPYPKKEALRDMVVTQAHQHGFVWLVTDRRLKTLGESGD